MRLPTKGAAAVIVVIAASLSPCAYAQTAAAPSAQTSPVATPQAPSLSPLQPTAYESGGSYEFTVQGTDPAKPVIFAVGPYTARFPGHPDLALPACPPPAAPAMTVPAAPAPASKPCVEISDDKHAITVKALPHAYGGVRNFVLVLPDRSAPQITLLLSSVAPCMARLCAAVATLVLIAIVVGMLVWGKKVDLANGDELSLARAVLIDKATSTYSLAKLQLYLWLAAGITSYLYLLMAKVTVQGLWQLPEVPANLPGVALVSVATAVLATGVSSAVGSKGSGEFKPTPADFITSGGDVAPERVQYFLWTLIAAPGMVVFTYMIDPGIIQGVPDLPNTFLQLMGLSAAGYVGGKLARGPGPKLTSVTGKVQAEPPESLNLTISGSDIQTKSSTFYLALLGGAKPPTDVVIPPNFNNQASKIDTSTGLATYLVMENVQPTDIALAAKPKLRLTILATDGEKAVFEFQTT